jgi:pectin methylesterase-like acyl-CoA thioesterase
MQIDPSVILSSLNPSVLEVGSTSAYSSSCHFADWPDVGDGVTDDTAAIQRAFNDYGDGNKIIFVDAGTYILTDTVIVPKDAKIHGEAWSQFAAFGNTFSDARYIILHLKTEQLSLTQKS